MNNQEESQYQIIYHLAQQNNHQYFRPYQNIIKQCKKLQQQLVNKNLQIQVQDLLSVCRAQYANGVQGQIFTVQIKHNQAQQQQKFMQILQQQFQQLKYQIFQQNSQKGQIKIQIVFLQGTQIKDLVLQMYIFLQQHSQIDVVVFIARQITDISDKNLYCFQKSLKNKKYIAIMCTFQTFQNQVQTIDTKSYEKYHISLYNSKELFCKFMYECVARQDIKAYLPSQILSLITDMDYYSLSFRESCRRFMYCLQRSLLISNKQRQWVDFSQLINLIEQSITKQFNLYFGYKNPLQKILKVILSQKETYTISQKAISLEIAMGAANYISTMQQQQFMNSIRISLINVFVSKQRYKKYSQFLLQEDDCQEMQNKKKKTRFQMLGIDTKKNITSKNKLQAQITKIIKEATISIRQQASQIKWEMLNFNLRIKPQIPFLIHNSLTQQLAFQKLINDITSKYSSNLSNFIEQYQNQNICQIYYHLSMLEYMGMIQINKKYNKHSIDNLYFTKASFYGKH